MTTVLLASLAGFAVCMRIAELEAQAETLANNLAAAQGEDVQPARDALHAWDRANQAELHALRLQR